MLLLRIRRNILSTLLYSSDAARIIVLFACIRQFLSSRSVIPDPPPNVFTRCLAFLTNKISTMRDVYYMDCRLFENQTELLGTPRVPAAESSHVECNLWHFCIRPKFFVALRWRINIHWFDFHRSMSCSHELWVFFLCPLFDVCVCLCACVCVCVCVCADMCVCGYVCMCLYVLCVCVCMCVCLCACICACVCLSACLCGCGGFRPGPSLSFPPLGYHGRLI